MEQNRVMDAINTFPPIEVNNDLTASYNAIKIVIDNNEHDMDSMDIQRLKDSLKCLSKYVPDDNEIMNL